MNDGTSRSGRYGRRLLLALLLTGTAGPAWAGNEVDTLGAAVDQPVDQQPQDIVVTGQSLFRDVRPEAYLDRDAIDSYGVSTVDELLGEVENEFDDDSEPLILVNGERVNSIEDIGGFPVEALRNVQVLPRGSAVRVGGAVRQRVISLTLQNRMRAATVTAAPKIATDGDWHAERGELLLTYLKGPTRANLALRARDESSLFESDRGIIQPDPSRPFAIEGNIVGFANSSGEIDPLLSALAGETVTVAPVPSSSNPTLADFAAVANQENTTDLGFFRTLRPDVRNYDLNGTASTRLAPWLTANANLRLTRNVSRSLRGLPSVLFRLPETNPFSPFSNEVGIALYGQDPLRSRYARDSGEGRLTFNGRFGQWGGNLNLRHSESKDVIDTDRVAGFGSVTLADSVNPFATDLSDLIGITTDRATSQTLTDLAELTLTGPLAELPAGALQATVGGRLSWYRLKSRSTSLLSGDRDFRRNEQGVRAALDIPLTSRDAGVLPQLGNLTGSAEIARTHFSDAGSLDHWALGLTWEPISPLQLRGSIEENQNAPGIQILGNPIVETPQVRVFDPLTGETVDVIQITGGNPSILPEKVRINRLSSIVRLLPKYNLQLNAEYTDTNARNFISALPPASAAVMLAFPTRFVRDADGNLSIVDLRSVNFDSHREKRLRWGLSMRAKLGGGSVRTAPAAMAAESESSDDAAPAPQPESPVRRVGRPSTYLQLTANHTIVFSDKIVIRPELDTVDLLGGGALGIGGGRVRHQLDGTAAITSGGFGARIGVTWRGRSTLDTKIGTTSDTLRFSPLFLVNLRLFTDVRRLIPNSSWARGLRLSLDVVNATNSRQRVRDSFGNTPLQYQPAYRDPLGRTIEFEIRKVF